MLSIQAVRGLPRLRARDIVPRIISLQTWAPLNPSRGLGERCKLPNSAVWGGAPAEIEFGAFPTTTASCNAPQRLSAVANHIARESGFYEFQQFSKNSRILPNFKNANGMLFF